VGLPTGGQSATVDRDVPRRAEPTWAAARGIARPRPIHRRPRSTTRLSTLPYVFDYRSSAGRSESQELGTPTKLGWKSLWPTVKSRWFPASTCTPHATSRPTRPGASDPPRSRLGVRRRSASWGPPVGADCVGSVEVGKHQDVEKFGASRRRKGFAPLAERSLHLVEGHCRDPEDRGWGAPGGYIDDTADGADGADARGPGLPHAGGNRDG
jgi:hypothetical protein